LPIRGAQLVKNTRAIIGTALAAVVLAGCASAGASEESPAKLEAQMIRWLANGQYGELYGVTYPAQQKVVSNRRYFQCMTRVARIAKTLGFDFSTIRVVHTEVVPKRKLVNVAGTNLRVLATPVSVALSAVEGGKRTKLPPSSWRYFARVGSRWRYIDGSIAAFSRPNCGT
jgi:hypothetical protein